LRTKLKKENANGQRYWEREESEDKPFLIAIADFHKPAEGKYLGSMAYTQSALWQYLYGARINRRFEEGQLIIEPEKVESHRFKDKVIPSGFFDLPEAENISAILFSNAGTLSKFNRMGAAAGFGAEGYGYYRMGVKYNPDPNTTFGEPFFKDACEEDYEEWWTQEIQVFHNPNAKHPLPFEALLGATNHYFEDGHLQSIIPSDVIFSSFSMLVRCESGESSAPQ
jgi:hypothetical protein